MSVARIQDLGRRIPEARRPLVAGMAASLLVHVAALIVFALADSGPAAADSTRLRHFYLCDGKYRCGYKEIPAVMRGPEHSLSGQMDVIEAIVLPKLGLAERQRGMPKLQKYEQPEKVQDGVNIKRENPTPKEVEHKASKPKKAEVDRRKTGLQAILGAPEDDDKRKRATSLDKIVGLSDGSVWGTGREAKPGNIFAGKVATLFRQHFVVPTSIPRGELGGLKVRVAVKRISPQGDILSYQVQQRSGNTAYDMACEALIRKFVPAEGGKLRLPEPDPQTLGYLNQHGMVVDLDGSLFQE